MQEHFAEYPYTNQAKVEDPNSTTGFSQQAVAAAQATEARHKAEMERQAKAAGRSTDAGNAIDPFEGVDDDEAKKDDDDNADPDDDADADAGDLDEGDIKTVMQQTNSSRARAIKGLKDNDRDIVNTIMALM